MKPEDFLDRGEAVRGLIEEMRGQRMPHAVLITGEEGVGKKTLAGMLASSLLCKAENISDRPCGICKICRRIGKGQFPDLMFLRTEDSARKTVGVDDVRDKLVRLETHGFSGSKRVILYTGEQPLTIPAQNALLKSLEEADDDVYFILVTNEESTILPTVRSRCRVIHMQPMTETKVLDILNKEQIGNSEHRQTVSRECGGSIGRAKNMLEDDDYWKLRELTDKTIFSVNSLKDIYSAGLLLKDQKADADRILTMAENRIHCLLREKQSGIDNGINGFSDLWRHMDTDKLVAICLKISEAQERTKSNVGWQANIEFLLLSIVEEIGK